MIRDYKFQRTEWKLRKKRKVGRKPLLWILVLLAAAGAGAGGYVLVSQRDTQPTEPTQKTAKNANVIPLQLPPPRQAPAPAGQN